MAFRPPAHYGFLWLGAIYLLTSLPGLVRSVRGVRRAGEFWPNMTVRVVEQPLDWRPDWWLVTLFGGVGLVFGVRAMSAMLLIMIVPFLTVAATTLAFAVRRERDGVELYAWDEHEDGRAIRIYSAHARGVPMNDALLAEYR